MALSVAALTLTFLATSEGVGDSFEPPAGITIFTAATSVGFYTAESLYRVYRSAEDFLANWPRESSCDDACARAIIAPIDFTRNMLIVIAPRGRGQETYDVVVTTVAASHDTLDVTFLELRHGKSTGD